MKGKRSRVTGLVAGFGLCVVMGKKINLSDTICKLILLYVIQREYCEGLSYTVGDAEIGGLYEKQAPICVALLSVSVKQSTLDQCLSAPMWHKQI